MKQVTKWLCLLCLLVWAFRQGAAVREYSPAVSLRFAQPLTFRQMEDARTLAAQGCVPWASFWSESRAWVGGTDAAVIRFWGDARLVFPAEYAHGTAPVDLASDSCGVSTELAWACYGAVDIVGLPLTVDGTEYRVCGVFEYAKPVALLPSREGHTAAELPGLSATVDSRQAALDFAAACGMAMPQQVLCGPEAASLAGALPWLAVLVCGAALIFRLPGGCWILLWAMLLWLPDWWLPDRWSHMLWWESLWAGLQARVRDWLSLAPAVRDVPLKLAWLKLMAASLGAAFLARPRK